MIEISQSAIHGAELAPSRIRRPVAARRRDHRRDERARESLNSNLIEWSYDRTTIRCRVGARPATSINAPNVGRPNAAGASPVSWTADGYVPTTFFGGTVGHGGPGGADEAFLRPDSVLVVFVATPFDDCSTPDPSIFSEGDPRYADTPIRLRCQMAPDHRYPIERYVDGLIGLRRYPSRLVFVAITGIPVADSFLAPQQILADPAMVEHPDPVFPDELAPACRGSEGAGTPARRIVSVAQGIEAAGGAVLLSSGCETNMLSLDQAARLTDVVRRAMAGGR